MGDWPRRRRYGKISLAMPLIILLVLTISSLLFVAPAAQAATPAASMADPAKAASESPLASGGAAQVVAGTDINLVNRFPAMQYGSNGAQSDTFSPPDVQVAVGPTEVVEMVNVHEQIFNKAGSTVDIIPLSAVFNVGSDDIGDPRIVYDNSSGHFFASVFDFSSRGVEVAVSKSSLAENGWIVYGLTNSNDATLSAANICIDQPFIGVGNDKVVVTGNDYYANGPASAPCRPLGNFAYQEVFVVNKAQMIGGGFLNWYYYYYDSSSFGWFGMRPVSSPTSTAYIVCTGCGFGILLQEVNGVPTSSTNPIITQFRVPFVAPGGPPYAPVSGSSDLLDTTPDTRVWSTAWSNGIWMAFNDACVPAGESAIRSCVRLVQVSVVSNQVVSNLDIFWPGAYLFYPAVTVDSFGGMGIVAGYSSQTLYPGIVATGIKNGESLGNLETNIVRVSDGTGYSCHYYRSSNLCRYGDYFGASGDSADPSMMWFAGEYETANGWATSVTGLRVGLAAVTLSYSTQDGSVAPQTASLSYNLQGSGRSAVLTSSPRTFYMDVGSSWSASSQLGGTASERWVSSGNPGKQVSQDDAESVTYYHQYLVTTAYSVTGGGAGYAAPAVSCTQFGGSVATTAGSSLWADARSNCSYPQSLPGSSAGERWASASVTASVAGSGAISQTYYHQYFFTLDYSVAGGGQPTPPTLTSVQFGAPFSQTLTSTSTGYWLDSGTSWNVNGLLGGSTSSERWTTSATLSGSLTAKASESLSYQHQYYLSVAIGPSEGGLTSVSSGWYNAGANVGLSASGASGWQFQGWSGNGLGAFSGSSLSSSFILNGPANETGIFYPGLTVSASESGSVQYSFGTTHGTVASGGTFTVFAPKGTTVILTPSSASFLYSFSGWGGALSGSTSPGQVQLNGPSSVSASFGYNFTVIGGLVAAVAVAVLGAAFFLRRRSGGTSRGLSTALQAD